MLPVHRLGVRLRPTLRFPGGEAVRARNLAFAGVGALVAQQLSVLAIMGAAYQFGPEQTFPTYWYAQQVYLLPYAVLAFRSRRARSRASRSTSQTPGTTPTGACSRPRRARCSSWRGSASPR